MNTLDRIKKAHIAIMRHNKFCAFSGVIACGKVEVRSDVPTAYTDGWNVTYGDEFMQSLTDAELRFVVLHECMHKAYRHLNVWKELWKKDQRKTNIAADHFVNLALMDTDASSGFIAMPAVGIQPDAQYRGKSVQQIFDMLPDDPQDDGDPESGSGGGMDDHGWEEASERSAEQQTKDAEEIQRALRQGEQVAKRRGSGGGSSSVLMADLLKPKLDWRQLLRDFVQETCAARDESTWAKPNRRYLADDVYMPSMQGVQMGELAVVFDTSGSCFGGSVMQAFASELAAIIESVRPERVRVLYCDSKVSGEQSFEDGQFSVTSMRIKGGGGTDLPAAFDYIKSKGYKPQACVVLTDGETPFGSAPPYPVLWAMTGSIVAPYGVSIRLEV